MPPSFERLSFLDTTFLALESSETHMHVASVLIMESEGMATPEGGLDIDRVRRYMAGRIHMAPRYRQKLAWIPIERHPVWVDDEHFNLEYHVRHTALPLPGTETQLRALTGRIVSQGLDLGKPLWEMWLVEGLEGGRFAIINKIHHCMIDGVSGAELMAMILNFGPDSTILEPREWAPRPMPTGAELLVAEHARLTRSFFDAAKGLRNSLDHAEEVGQRIWDRLQVTTKALRSGWLTPTTRTPLNEKIGPNRRFAWLDTPLSEVQEVRRATGASINDIVLAISAGAIRRFLIEHRGFDPLGTDFRAMVPVSVRARTSSDEGGNQVAMWLVGLHIGEGDPLQRLAAIRAETLRLKRENQAEGAAALVAAASGTPVTLLSLGLKAAADRRPFNMTITNVPGPQFPLYLGEARMLATYPLVPLWQYHGLSIALFSYSGTINWGVVADYDLVPDMDDFLACLKVSEQELLAAAAATV